MNNLWIGDFRCKQLQHWMSATKLASAENVFIADENAELSWLNTIAINKIGAKSSTGTNVIIALGFNDCLNSCSFEKLSLQQIASDYCKSINNLKTQFAGMNFYFCCLTR